MIDSTPQTAPFTEEIISNYKNLYHKVSNFNIPVTDALKKIRDIIKKYKEYKAYYDGTSQAKIYVSEKEIRNFLNDTINEIEDLYQDIFVINQLKKVNRESIIKAKAKKFDSAHLSPAIAKDPLLSIMHAANRQKASTITEKEEITAVLHHRLDILTQINSCLNNCGLHPLIFKRNIENKRYNILIRYSTAKGLEEQCQLLLDRNEIEKNFLIQLKNKNAVVINGETIPFHTIRETLYSETVFKEDEIELYFLKKYRIAFDKNNKQHRINFSKLCTDVTRSIEKGNIYALHDDSFWRLMHPKVIEAAKIKYEAGNRADAVEAAFRDLNHHIRNSIPNGPVRNLGLSKLQANALMKEVFSVDDPVFLLVEKTNMHYKNIQQGYMEIYAGATMGIRNAKAQDNIDIDEEDAVEKLIICSHLFKVFDNRVI